MIRKVGYLFKFCIVMRQTFYPFKMQMQNFKNVEHNTSANMTARLAHSELCSLVAKGSITKDQKSSNTPSE